MYHNFCPQGGLYSCRGSLHSTAKNGTWEWRIFQIDAFKATMLHHSHTTGLLYEIFRNVCVAAFEGYPWKQGTMLAITQISLRNAYLLYSRLRFKRWQTYSHLFNTSHGEFSTLISATAVFSTNMLHHSHTTGLLYEIFRNVCVAAFEGYPWKQGTMLAITQISLRNAYLLCSRLRFQRWQTYSHLFNTSHGEFSFLISVTAVFSTNMDWSKF